MMRFGADDFFMIGIEEDQVGVRADGDGAFARVKAKKFCGRGGDELNKTIWRKMLAVDAASVDKAEAVLNAGAAIGNLGEVVFAKFLLLLEAEGAVVGGDDLQRVFRQALPEFFLMPFFAERRREDVLRAFKAGRSEEHTSELQSLTNLVCRLLLEKKKKQKHNKTRR